MKENLHLEEIYSFGTWPLSNSPVGLMKTEIIYFAHDGSPWPSMLPPSDRYQVLMKYINEYTTSPAI